LARCMRRVLGVTPTELARAESALGVETRRPRQGEFRP
jgi:hypothetical protein